MPLLDWSFLDALQTGALTALFVSLGMEAWSRRDRMMGWLATACLLVGLRHALLALGSWSGMNPDLVNRAQSVLATFGFVALCANLAALFPRYIPPKFPGWMLVGLLPNLLRNLVMAQPGRWDAWMHQAANLGYLVGCAFILTWTLRARQDGDRMGKRLFPGLLVLTLPVLTEIAAISLFGLRLRLSGISLMILAMIIGNSRQWMVVDTMETRLRRMENELEVWRSLVPGSTFRTNQPSLEMEALFGESWPDRIKARPAATFIGSDGASYRFQSRVLYHHERAGWYERDEIALPGHQGFLAGWTVALGMDDPLHIARLQALLQSWGANVQLWGTVPPREGPYPSVLMWAREPSILTVWRESDLMRRRSRWIQIGGPITVGPHARLDPSASDLDIQHTLDRLLSRR